ncbi:MAG TPA: hypothetical protein ENN29_07475 [Candidatus Hydrogenedentes bacterium]|nr:hypothetical protein [Candidatus Hydrogenedentota bacterium]
MALVYRLGVFVVLLIIAVALGLYLGKISVGEDPTLASLANQTESPDAAATKQDMEKPSDIPETAPPLFFFPGKATDADWDIVGGQAAMAAEADIHRYMVAIAPGWFDEEQSVDIERYEATLSRYVALDGQAAFLIWVNLNPPVRWFEQHPEAAMRVNDVLQPYPSPSSTVWQEAARRSLVQLINSLESGAHGNRILGYVLCALQDQRWLLPEERDVSAANQRGFQQWLQRYYKSDEALQKAWNDENASAQNAAIMPECDEPEEPAPLFLELPAQQRVVDFQRYSSESVADALAAFASVTAETSAKGLSLIIAAPYGHSFEALPNDCGQFGLELLLESDLNTLISPVSYADRGLGGVGGVMGPVDSMLVRGKKWFLIDDTRTGLERDPVSGEFARIRGINVEDVYEVQRRNFALALAYRMGLVWTDPQGEGWLHDTEQWTHFKQLHEIYARQMQEDDAKDADGGEAVMTVVVDESSRFYLHCDGRVNAALLQKGRDAAFRSGVRLRFHLLRDVLEDFAPPTPVYLFLNAFRLTEAERSRLHGRLAREQAAAIWVYAPGYVAENADAKNIAAVTGMDVRQFEAPFETGSMYLLSGQYMRAEEKFGGGDTWSPAFYIEPEEETDFLAQYVNAKDKGSVAIVTLPEGWTSVYVAEPGLTPALLCELLQILEQHIYTTPVERSYFDALFARDDIVALHASHAGKRAVYFGGFYDIQDLLDPSLGWLQKESIMLPVRTGETRILRRKPIQAGAG